METKLVNYPPLTTIVAEVGVFLRNMDKRSSTRVYKKFKGGKHMTQCFGTSYRESNISEKEKKELERIFEMVMVVRQQIMLRKSMT